MATSPSAFRILLFADTHLGFDQPVRPRARRRRRGPDFFANFRRVLEDAIERRVDLVVHGGDLFFRSRVPAAIVDEVYRDLLAFAEHGIPLMVVPGNHERSRLPSSLFLQHPLIHVFDRPRTFLLTLKGARVALGGFPNVRQNVRDGLPELLAATTLLGTDADVRLLCLHQTIEGATVGPSGYTFRRGRDVIRRRDLPDWCDAVLAGHIHRHQLLHPEAGGGPPPVFYPGSTERTSFAEAAEDKGYSLLTFGPCAVGWELSKHEFVSLPTRPMVTIDVPAGLRPPDVPMFLKGIAREQPEEAIVRFRHPEKSPASQARHFSGSALAEHLPQTMNVQFASGFFGPRGERRSPGPTVRRELASEVHQSVPPAPGAYAFTDGKGRLLYVGKSVDLRRRMASYFRGNISSLEPHRGRLVASIRGFSWWRTPSELLALLLEDALVKELQPPMNKRLREVEESRYLEVTDDTYPACVVVEHADDFGEREVWGPFRDRYFAERLHGVLREALGIRACRDPEPRARCLEHEIGRCVGPCRDAVTPDDYAELVGRARAFLRGESGFVIQRLVTLRDRAAEEHRFEQAAALRDAVDVSRRFIARQRFGRRFLEAECRFVDADGIEYAFERGSLVQPDEVVVEAGVSSGLVDAAAGFAPDEAVRLATSQLRRSGDDARALTDRIAIVWSALLRLGVHGDPFPNATSPLPEEWARLTDSI